ncbi:SDR family NAD(P)-dependent oxidoreductase [Lacihabitans sp. CCS-44]|uniref:SDR family NAD(P)-dependent oxidoreductase n=1 Tax=Lacihabitans sp. CCS-44 TaxID=2487331 RepID=UPI0020CD1FAA|nr:SDR family oxidoreductase [Lacihabitans sp. CCS-44]
MQIDLRDKKIIVTGASSGIGFEIARALIEAGATVAIHYNSNQKGAEKLLKEGNASKLFKADLSNENDTKLFFEAVMSSFIKVDMIVNNVGIFEYHSIDANSNDWMNIWHKTMNTNLHSVGLLTHLGLQHFKESKAGRMVYVASRAAFRGETEDYLAYAASKGALVSLGRTVARSFGQYNIKSFILAPGFTKTPMAEDYIRTNGEESILKDAALKELTLPEHISPVVVLIAAGLMDHATGSTIDFNAGSYIH